MAGDLLGNLLKALASDSFGEKLLVVIGRPEFLEVLVTTACTFEWHGAATPSADTPAVSERQTIAMTLLVAVAHLAVKEEVRPVSCYTLPCVRV